MTLAETQGAASAAPDLSDFHEIDLFFRKEFDPELEATALEHIRVNARRDNVRKLPMEKRKKGALILVGGGPSAKADVRTIRRLARDKRNRLLCLNDAHDWLLDNGIRPWGVAFLEVSKWPWTFMRRPHKKVKYLLASWCHPSAYERLEGYQIIRWHPLEDGFPELTDLYTELFEGESGVAGGANCAMRIFALGWIMGYYSFHLFGLDSSYEEQSHVYYHRDAVDKDQLIVSCNGTKFKSAGYLARQARDFHDILKHHGHKMDITVYGEGLLPHIARLAKIHVDNKPNMKRVRRCLT
jgi:hypothetical protein